MNLKYELTKDLKHITDKIADHEAILQREEIQRQTDIKHFVESKLEYYRKRKQVVSECIKLIYGGTENDHI